MDNATNKQILLNLHHRRPNGLTNSLDIPDANFERSSDPGWKVGSTRGGGDLGCVFLGVLRCRRDVHNVDGYVSSLDDGEVVAEEEDGHADGVHVEEGVPLMEVLHVAVSEGTVEFLE